MIVKSGLETSFTDNIDLHVGLSILLVTVALYTTLFVKHFPTNGQSTCCLQLVEQIIIDLSTEALYY